MVEPALSVSFFALSDTTSFSKLNSDPSNLSNDNAETTKGLFSKLLRQENSRQETPLATSTKTPSQKQLVTEEQVKKQSQQNTEEVPSPLLPEDNLQMIQEKESTVSQDDTNHAILSKATDSSKIEQSTSTDNKGIQGKDPLKVSPEINGHVCKEDKIQGNTQEDSEEQTPTNKTAESVTTDTKKSDANVTDREKYIVNSSILKHDNSGNKNQDFHMQQEDVQVKTTEDNQSAKKEDDITSKEEYLLGPTTTTTSYWQHTVTLDVTANTQKQLSATTNEHAVQENIHSDSMINQLQKIIDRSSETGTVRIEFQQVESKTVQSNTQLTTDSKEKSLQDLQPQASAIALTTEEINKENNRITKRGTNLLQNKNEENVTNNTLLNNKARNEKGEHNSQNDQKGSNQNREYLYNQSRKTSFSLSSPYRFDKIERIENSFLFASTNESGQFSSNITQTLLGDQPLQSSAAQTITLSSGIVVREEDVVRQFIERFQINGRSLETRINIKLNPAELGKLNVTLSVKEGVVQASVIAQSTVTRDIIEKNFDKLKTALKQQGFALENFVITVEEEISENSSLFQEFAQQDRRQDSTHYKGQPILRTTSQEDKEKIEGHHIENDDGNEQVSVTI